MQAVLGGDEALGEDEVVEGGGADVRDALRVALDGDGGVAGCGTGTSGFLWGRSVRV